MKSHRFTLLLSAAFAAVLVAGCGDSDGGELSKSDEKTLQNNMTRQLTPEEIARLGGGATDANRTGETPPDAAKPPKKEGQ